MPPLFWFAGVVRISSPVWISRRTFFGVDFFLVVGVAGEVGFCSISAFFLSVTVAVELGGGESGWEAASSGVASGGRAKEWPERVLPAGRGDDSARSSSKAVLRRVFC